jgi:RNA polymerase sigma factor (sigma-70 family)
MCQVHEGLVKSIATPIAKRRRAEFDDAIAYGFEGFLAALDRFDPAMGGLANYARWWVSQATNRHLDNEASAVRVTVHARGRHNRLTRVRAALSADSGGREPTDAELATAAGVTVADVVKDTAIRWATPTSLDAPAAAGLPDGPTRLDLLPDDEAERGDDVVERGERAAYAVRMLASLRPREREVLAGRFGIGGGGERTLAECGEAIGRTRERARQIEAKALRKLRAAFAERGREAYASE